MGSARVRQFFRLSFFAFALAGCSSHAFGGALMPSNGGAAAELPAGDSVYATTVRYVVQFYPLWFYTSQASFAPANQFLGPDRMSPEFYAVVAPNDDTLYANAFVDVSKQPAIVTIPSTKVTFSVLIVTMFGNIVETGIKTPGTYALIGPHSKGSIPSGITQVHVSDDFHAIAIRSDKFDSSGKNVKPQSDAFRKTLHLASLSDYKLNNGAGKMNVVPVAFYRVGYKRIADLLATKDSIKFLTMLQADVAAKSTPALSTAEKALSDQFDGFFNAKNRDAASLIAATRKAHDIIVNHYLNHTGKTNWIAFVFNSNFNDDPLLRSSIAEFIQVANNHSTAQYYQTFDDGTGAALDGSRHTYVLTFAKNQIPQAKRFWSLTAYVPNSITLHRNSLHKYVVASYTPGLQTASDGSITITMAYKQPGGVPASNWLPVPNGPFNVMLRDYGPEGSVKAGTYVPPAIVAESSSR